MRSVRPLAPVLIAFLAACGAEERPSPEAAVPTDGEGPLPAALAARAPEPLRPADVPAVDDGAVLETDEGEATFYADVLDRKRTASGEPLDQRAMVAAHRRYPFGTRLRVTNLANRRSAEVRVIDRGPFGAPKVAKRKVIDLSRAAAERLGFIDRGRARVRLEVLEWGDGVEA